MKHSVRFFSVVAAAVLFLAPVSTFAAAGTAFGGRITLIAPCLSISGPSVWVTITPAPATKQPTYIWTAATVRGVPPSSPDPAPYAVGQEILGVADTLYYCCLPPAVPVPPTCEIPSHPYWIIAPWLMLPGQRMQYANQSLSPSTGAEIQAAALAAPKAAMSAVISAFKLAF